MTLNGTGIQPPAADRVLVIKLSALGDFVQALGPFKAIRETYPKAQITLLTTGLYEELAVKSGYFDAVWLDARPRNPLGFWVLRQRLLSGQFDMVFDLQTSDRSSLYWQLMWPHRPGLSGIASGASHPHSNSNRDAMHTIDRQKEQLALAGITSVPAPDLSWVDGDLSQFALPDRFALIVPGGAAHRPEKRWPADFYGRAAAMMMARDITPVLIGTKAEAPLMAQIKEICSKAIDLSGQTQLLDLAVLARSAVFALGNDTGPMHAFAAAGCSSIVLFSQASDPTLCAPRGSAVDVLCVSDLADLSVQQVMERVSEFTLAFRPSSA